MAMALGILFTMIGGSFEGSAAIGGVTVGLPLGGIIGILIGGWLVLHFWRPEEASG
jgi:Na+/glutamate symporter